MKFLPPIAHEDLLVEDRPIGTEEGDRVEAVVIRGVSQADVVGLAPLGRVSVVTSQHQAGAGEGRVLD